MSTFVRGVVLFSGCWFVPKKTVDARAAENHLRQTDTEHQHSLTPFLFTVALHPEASWSSTWFVNTTVVVMGLDFIHYISVIIMKCCSVSLLSQRFKQQCGDISHKTGGATTAPPSW